MPCTFKQQIFQLMTSQDPNVELREVTKSFRSGPTKLQILEGISFSLSSGQSMSIVGPSGSGKSTLLQIIGTLDRPDSGTIRIAGENPLDLSEVELAAFRNRHIGFIFQDHHLLPQLTVLENVLIPALAVGTPNEASIDRARSLCETLGLADRITHRPGQLSGGQRERVAIARALVMEPSIILADEPTGNLDSKTAAQVIELLAQLPKSQNAVLIAVTHSHELASAMDQSWSLADGRLTDLGR
jgi:lipoprotein-releasing system ATP-binding protein